MKIVIGAVLATTALAYWFSPNLAAIALSHDDIAACAVDAAIADEMARGGPEGKGQSRDDAINAIILDDGYHPDYTAIAEGYRRHFGLGLPRTVFDAYVEEGKKLCLSKVLKGETISYPTLIVSGGYHVVRSLGGSATLVRNGEQPPLQFLGC